ncbi:MAG: Stk1 family PASTA domain-containing Ser/Thr kinase [Clostridia bacterium]|jgi:probable serine/threonine-protein kinase sps1
MNLEGRILGNRYEIIEKVGNGGMATVYKATDLVLKRYVAVKVLRDEFTTDEEFIKRFETEAQSAARLVHANIVSIFDVGVDNGIYYIVMELIQGKTLKEIIVEERGPLPWKWSVNVAIQIASALEMAHKNNIIHRDIKPHNIIITEDGIAKVTDFGIAKAVSNSTITAFGTTIGSVHYFSPEHARGGYTDAKSDIYSLGVVMYEMVTGKVPFDADTPVSVALKHMQEEPIPPIEANPHLPEAVNKIILKALKKDPMLRYQTATELLQDLRMALKNPSGDFVNDEDYDPTARTQRISTQDVDRMQKNSRKKEDNKFVAFIKNHKVFSSFIGLILLFFIAFGGTMLVLKATNPKEVEMPNIVGLTKDEAQQKVESAKLKFVVSSEEYNTDVEENYIISQEPTYVEGYNRVKEGSEVKVVVSKGTEKTKVPKVVGMSKDDAIEAIENAKLKAEIVEESSKKVQEGYVINQETDANTEVNAGETVKIHVSTGTEKATVPGVVGKSQDEAKKMLQDLGFVVTVTTSEDNSKNNGVVLKQSLDEGKSVDKGSAITITVNTYEASKSAQVTIDVKSYLPKTTTTTNNEATSNNTDKTANVKVTVSNNGTGFSKNNVSSTVTDTIYGKGEVTITITITGTSGEQYYSGSKVINLNNTDSVTFKNN